MSVTQRTVLDTGSRKGECVVRRSADFGMLPELPSQFSTEFSLGLYRKICFNRFFELAAAQAVRDKRIRAPIYLSLGQEHIPAAISAVLSGPMIFAQHRAHSYYLSFGGNPVALIDELLGRDTGCAQGRGGSASIHEPRIGMFGHSGLMGDQVPIAVGAALASGKTTLAVVGDASVEEDYVFGAMGYAATKKTQVLFVCEDNDLSILTPVATRRNWNVCDVAQSFGMRALDITDDPWLIAHSIQSLLPQLPAYLNVRTCRELWHSGAGRDGDPEWNRFALIQDTLEKLGLGEARQAIEVETQSLVQAIWEKQLRK